MVRRAAGPALCEGAYCFGHILQSLFTALRPTIPVIHPDTHQYAAALAASDRAIRELLERLK